MATTVNVATPTCMMCGKSDMMEVPEEGYLQWVNGTFVQNAFPEMSADQREMLISGTHPKCWDEMFSSEED